MRQLLDGGELSRAEEEIKKLISSYDGEMKLRLEFELERMRRWRLEYRYSEDEAFSLLREEILDLTLEEFRKLMEMGCVDHKVIDGELKILRRFIPNVFWLCPHLKNRRRKINETDRRSKEVLRERAELVMRTGVGHVLPLRYRVRSIVRVKGGEVPGGERLRIWVPIPRVCDLHPQVRIVGYSQEPYLAEANHPQRTAYLEISSGREEAWIEYEFVSFGFCSKVDPKLIMKSSSTCLSRYLQERPPHIVFTRYLRSLAERIVGGEENPYLKAVKIWRWITRNVRYAYAHDYSLYDCIAEYVARNLRGDCGMQAILFITLCRIVGVPARWESGWYMNPVRWGMHDWARFYVEPYGWLYADPSFGGLRHGEGWRSIFYLGSVEGFRLAFNAEISEQFDPPKVHFRSDPVDNQRGEVESDSGNLYYDCWDFELKVLEIHREQEDASLSSRVVTTH